MTLDVRAIAHVIVGLEMLQLAWAGWLALRSGPSWRVLAFSLFALLGNLVLGRVVVLLGYTNLWTSVYLMPLEILGFAIGVAGRSIGLKSLVPALAVGGALIVGGWVVAEDPSGFSVWSYPLASVLAAWIVWLAWRRLLHLGYEWHAPEHLVMAGALTYILVGASRVAAGSTLLALGLPVFSVVWFGMQVVLFLAMGTIMAGVVRQRSVA